ncbi:MAG: class I SAM-dependent methyltransferase [Acidobacteriota bacterium]
MTVWIIAGVPLGSVRRILDLGCGGGGTMSRLTALAPGAEIHGIDYSDDSVRVASQTVRDLLPPRRAYVCLGSVSALPYGGARFDLALAVESHYFWPDLPRDLVEIRRVLAARGTLVIGGGVYAGGRRRALNLRLARTGAMNCPSLPELADALARAGFVDVTLREDARRSWFSVLGVCPAERGSACADSDAAAEALPGTRGVRAQEHPSGAARPEAEP